MDLSSFLPAFRGCLPRSNADRSGRARRRTRHSRESENPSVATSTRVN